MNKTLFMVIASISILTGCGDSNFGGVHIPEPHKEPIPVENAEMATIIQMSGGNCVNALAVYEQQSFLGKSNVYGVKCQEYGNSETTTYLVDKNLNTVTK
jgi:hypothetical protein